MNNFVKVGLTTGVVLSAIMPYGGVHAATEDLKWTQRRIRSEQVI